MMIGCLAIALCLAMAAGCGGEDGTDTGSPSGSGSADSGSGAGAGEEPSEDVAGHATFSVFSGQVVALGSAAAERMQLRATFVRHSSDEPPCALEEFGENCVLTDRSKCDDSELTPPQYLEPSSVSASGGSLGSVVLERSSANDEVAFNKTYEGESKLAIGDAVAFSVEGSESVPALEVTAPPQVGFNPVVPSASDASVELKADEDLALSWSREGTAEGKLAATIVSAADGGEADLAIKTLTCSFDLASGQGTVPKEAIARFVSAEGESPSASSFSLQARSSSESVQGSGDNRFHIFARAAGSQYSYAASITASSD